MKSFFRSIKLQVWLRFEIVVAAMLVLTYFFLVAMFSVFYEWMKVEEIDRSLDTIQKSWNEGDIDIARTIEGVALENKMYIEIYFPRENRSIPFNNIGGALTFAGISKSEYCKAVTDSDTGIVYRRFRDIRENNIALMVCSYVGADKSTPDAYIFMSTYLQPLGTTLEIFKRMFGLVSLVTVVLTFLISILFATKIASPIIRMNKAAKQLPQGKYDYPVSERDFAEIKQLSETLHHASGEIAKTDGLRKELMANISHDLRTPLTMIKAYAEMIRDLSGNNPEKRERHIKVIIDETDRLSSLVNDILDLSKLEAGVSELKVERFNFGERLKSVVARFDIMREKEGVCVELNGGSNIPIDADPVKLEQVVYNLINNAVTYVGSDNVVNVRLYRTVNGTVRFEVTDRGDGISPEELPYVWDRYYRANDPTATHKRAKMGSGIGLSIVKNILELHGFVYGVNSVVGEGSTFWFEAPDPLAAATPQEKPPSRFGKLIDRKKQQ
ncbi:MAG: HAMP domain-containing histidine kinase [Ruminococcaceae bacterium]|nr:HAMP domain-containing histidine kinase [Oscillospiraceae bacterium]